MLDLALIEKYISDTFLNNSDNNKYKQETFNIIDIKMKKELTAMLK